MKVVNFGESNSIISQYMTELRDVKLQADMLRFRHNLQRIGEIMAYEISRTLEYKKTDITTPLAKMQSPVIDTPVVLATIFRAGLPFHQGFLNYFDHAENAFVSAYRKYKEKENFDVCIEYLASPNLDGKTLIIADPMLATGASMELSYRALITKGNPAHIHVCSVIASKQAVEYIEKTFPQEKTTIWLGDVDPEINEHSYIVPGLGDAGDLAFGKKE